MNKVFLFLLFSFLTITSMAQEKIKQTAGRDQLGDFAPKFAELNDDVLSAKSGAALTNSVCVTVVWLRSLHSLAKV